MSHNDPNRRQYGEQIQESQHSPGSAAAQPVGDRPRGHIVGYAIGEGLPTPLGDRPRGHIVGHPIGEGLPTLLGDRPQSDALSAPRQPVTRRLETTQLGQTGLEITRVGFGAWAIGGGGWEFGWGPQDDEQSIAAIHRALEQGVNWIDTAAAYGFGRSERIVGRAVEGLSERPYVFTKCSLLEGPERNVVHSLKRDSILCEAEASLRRLGVDAIDLYQVHWPIPVEDIEEGWAALAELKEQGLVRHIGVSNFDVSQLRQIQHIAPVETLQPQYSLIERDVERRILPFAEQEGIGVIVYSPMGSGMLTGSMSRERIERLANDDWRKHDDRFREPQLSRNLALVGGLEQVADRYDTTAGAVAVAWTLHNPAVDGAIVGFRRPDQVDPILVAANLQLTDQDVSDIEASSR
jgi:aryl-alcohol dehydrogenase-like predicted oxidoreductase